MFPVHTILHPTDFSANSMYALHMAAALARDYDAELIICHVHQIPVALYGEGVVPVTPDNSDDLKSELQQIQVPRVRTTHVLADGEPVDEILRIAQDRRADLIVMGTHGRRGLTRLIMGSVAELVVRRAACPVLTVRTPVPEAAPTAQGAAEPAEVTV